jgi:hypothetical protein
MRGLAIAGVSAVLVGAAWSYAPDGGPRPELRVLRTAPLTLAGSGFAAREHVRLALRAGRRQPIVRNVQATASGRFRATFGLLVAVEPCEGTLVLTATGSRGSGASWKRECRPPSRRPPSIAE